MIKVEQYDDLLGRTVLVVRDDLSFPSVSIAKMRGIRAWTRKQRGKIVAVVDTWRSRNGYCLAEAARGEGLECIEFRPFSFHPDSQKIVNEIAEAGARIVELPPSVPGFPMQAVLEREARKMMRNNCGKSGEDWVMLPRGAKLEETRDGVRDECKKLLEKYRPGTIVVPCGTGTHLTGIYTAILESASKCKAVGVFGYTINTASLYSWMSRFSGGYPLRKEQLSIVNTQYTYSTPLTYQLPFPACAFYETKAWYYIDNEPKLKEPIMFWNIGSK